MTAKISSLFWHQTGLRHAFSSCVCANRAYYCLFIRHTLVISKLSSRVNISQFRHSCIWAFTIVIVECSLVVSQSVVYSTIRSLKEPKKRSESQNQDFTRETAGTSVRRARSHASSRKNHYFVLHIASLLLYSVLSQPRTFMFSKCLWNHPLSRQREWFCVDWNS